MFLQLSLSIGGSIEVCTLVEYIIIEEDNRVCFSVVLFSLMTIHMISVVFQNSHVCAFNESVSKSNILNQHNLN